MNSAEFSGEIGLNSAEFFRSKNGSSNSAENMNSLLLHLYCTITHYSLLPLIYSSHKSSAAIRNVLS